MKSFLTALQFLTIFPLGRAGSRENNRELAQSAMYFPLVGALIGSILVVVDLISRLFFPQLIVNLFILIVLVLITGALHLDGFIDSMDGLLSGKKKKKILEIMRDSRVGSFGVLAAIFLVLLKLSFLNEIVSYIRYPILIIMPVVSRWAAVYTIWKYPYARDTSGIGKSFAKLVRGKELIVATIFTALLVISLLTFKGVVIWLVVFLVLLIMTNWISKKIGGMTGDTYGAIVEIAEIVVLISASLINSINLYLHI